MIQGVSQRNLKKKPNPPSQKHPFQEPTEDQIYMISF